jgi:exoribonuclease-2
MLNALAVFKNKPVIVMERVEDKIVITLSDNARIKVREKDIEIIHPGPVNDFSIFNEGVAAPDISVQNNNLRETWELLLADCNCSAVDDSEGSSISLKELAELAFDEYSPSTAWAAYRLLLDGLYFSCNASVIRPRPRDLVEADEKKREEKQRVSDGRKLFLGRLRSRHPILLPEDSGGPSDDRRFIQDIEALALGKTNKSRTMKDIGLGETPEDAHALLLEFGF